MIRSISRLSVASVTLCLVIVSAWSADIVVKFRKDALAKMENSAADPGRNPLTFAFNAPSDVSRRDAFTDPRTLAVVGGVMFTAVATPAPGIPECPNLNIQMDAPNGKHLAIKFGTNVVRGNIYDWELLPLAQFIKDGQSALYTYVKGQGEYHRAFKDNLVGLNLFLLDNASITRDFPRAHLLIENKITGYPQSEPATKSLAAWETLKPLLSFGPEVNQMMFVDRDTEFKFRPVGQELEISGAPYWLLLYKGVDGSGQSRP